MVKGLADVKMAKAKTTVDKRAGVENIVSRRFSIEDVPSQET
jgi:hypothetical protein